MFLRTLVWQLGWRSAVEGFLWCARRSQDPEAAKWPAIVVLLGSLAGGPVLLLFLLSFARWVVTGRGPGLRLVVYDLGGPTQRVRSRSRSGSRPGHA